MHFSVEKNYRIMHILYAFELMPDVSGGRGRWSFLSEIRQPRVMGPNGRRREKGKLSDILKALNSM